MDPWLERPDLWPDVHNGLIAAIRDTLGPRLRPRYYVALEERVYLDLLRAGEPMPVIGTHPCSDYSILVPPLDGDDAAWAAERLAGRSS